MNAKYLKSLQSGKGFESFVLIKCTKKKPLIFMCKKKIREHVKKQCKKIIITEKHEYAKLL